MNVISARLCRIVVGGGVLLAVRTLGSQTIELGSRSVALDEVVQIRVRGLRAGQSATLRALSRDRAGQEWEASGEFRADDSGSLDLSRQSPTSGSYTGIRPMGLFQSMSVAGANRGVARFESAWPDTVTTEIVLEIGGNVIARDTLRRTFTSSGVLVAPIRQDGLVGIRFSPKSGLPRAHVLVLGGSEGGIGSADVAAQLASHGFDALALAYFGVDSLPSQLAEIPLEYFGRALRLLAGDSTQTVPIAIVGTSKGAEAALLLAVRYPLVSGVVAYAPSSVAWSCICDSAVRSSWTWRGAPIPAVPPGADPDYRPASGSPLRPAVNYAFRLRNNPTPEAVIAVERTGAKLLLIAGADDALWPSADMAAAIRTRASSRTNLPPAQVLRYESAGHLIGKSYLPAGSSLIARGRIDTGGTPAGNARAQADSWPKVVDFLASLRPR